MARTNELNLKKEAAIKADAHELMSVQNMRSKAAFQQLGDKYFMQPETIAAIVYGSYEARRTKASTASQ